MIFYDKNKDNEKMIIVNCDCGCEEKLSISKIDEADRFYMTLHSCQFYTKQEGIFKIIIHRIKTAFMMLLGKEYLLTDIVLTKEDINKLKDNLEDIIK